MNSSTNVSVIPARRAAANSATITTAGDMDSGLAAPLRFAASQNDGTFEYERSMESLV
jgi:hypothetical protein